MVAVVNTEGNHACQRLRGGNSKVGHLASQLAGPLEHAATAFIKGGLSALASAGTSTTGRQIRVVMAVLIISYSQSTAQMLGVMTKISKHLTCAVRVVVEVQGRRAQTSAG
jgi:hypothetical protein